MSVLALYRGVATVATPVVLLLLRKRQIRGREDPARLGERLGHAGLARPGGPLVWVHAASVGEALSALPLIDAIRTRWPGLTILMTTGTVTSARLMAERLPTGVIHQFAPVDLPAAVRRFLVHWRPALGIVIESELWPNLLRTARASGVELALVNGRISAKSYASWRRVRPIIAELLGLFSIVLAQSREDLRHLRALGARDAQRLGNLKFVAPPLAADPGELAELESALGTRPRWLAASTHPGEEELIAEAHTDLRARHPGLLTIVVPRHPDRGPDVAGLFAAHGVKVARRSAAQPISPDTEIYIGDTLGELGLWYRLADVVFVGGSLVPKGGQNVLEPAKLNCAILTGPHTSNFLRVSKEMAEAGALRPVTGAADLAHAVDALLGDPDARRAMIAAAAKYAATEAGVLDDIVGALAPALDRAAAGR
jgi:3-deoxy-D-manno-octulosonic-acid transferase